MGSQAPSPNSEAAIWARLMQAQQQELTPEVAEYLLTINFGEHDHRRMLELADHSESGTLASEDLIEFDGYLHVGNLLAVMKSRARVVLQTKPR